jgi:hypothetical protein
MAPGCGHLQPVPGNDQDLIFAVDVRRSACRGETGIAEPTLEVAHCAACRVFGHDYDIGP